jgi:aryl carrier-like protein
VSSVSVQAQAQSSVAMTERRNAHREELATLLALDSTLLSDNARLTDDLALDSLAMMSLLTWLETRGVVVGDRSTLTSVDDILSLLDQKATAGAFPCALSAI